MNSRTRNLLIFILGLFVGLNWPKIKKYSEPYWQKIKNGTNKSWHKLNALFWGQKEKTSSTSPKQEKSAPAIKSEEKVEPKTEEKKEESKEPLTVEKIMKAREEKEEDKGKVKVTIKEESK